MKEFTDKFKENDKDHLKFTEDISKLFDTKADQCDMKEMLEKMDHLLKEIEEAMKWKQPIVQVNNRIDKIEIQIQQLLDGLGKNNTPAIETPSKDLKDLEDQLNRLKEDFMRLQSAMNDKADLAALKELEKYLLARLEDLENSLDGRFADKNETKKAIKALKKQIKNLYDLLMNQQSGHDHGDDAMFAKKPLGGWSCASCAKDIVNLQGTQAEFVPWRQWPFRDPNDRLAKSGQGFSRILSKMKPEYTTQPHFYPHESIQDEQYDTVNQEKFTIKKKKKKVR